MGRNIIESGATALEAGAKKREELKDTIAGKFGEWIESIDIKQIANSAEVEAENGRKVGVVSGHGEYCFTISDSDYRSGIAKEVADGIEEGKIKAPEYKKFVKALNQRGLDVRHLVSNDDDTEKYGRPAHSIDIDIEFKDGS